MGLYFLAALQETLQITFKTTSKRPEVFSTINYQVTADSQTVSNVNTMVQHIASSHLILKYVIMRLMPNLISQTKN